MKLHINKNLISIKCVLFLFFGALGSLLPFLPLHMSAKGLSKDESVIVSVVSPLIALIGPLVAAPLADRLAGGFGGTPRSKTGRYLRVMISLCFVLATVFYWLLMIIPRIKREPLAVSFVCDEQGGFILQERCGAERTCYNWGASKGSVEVISCKFSCNASVAYKGEVTTLPPEEESSGLYDEDYNYGLVEVDANAIYPARPDPVNENSSGFLIPHPHMCYKNQSGDSICEVYTEFSKPIRFQLGLNPSVETEENDTEDSTCKYAFADPFHCRIPQEIIQTLSNEVEDCHPYVLCGIHDPFNNTDSLLKRSQCGYDNNSFWLYLFIKSFADIFLAAAVALLGAAVVIATRETSTGRGDVGKQFAAGALAFAIFAAIIGGCAEGRFLDAMICFTVLLVVGAIILLADQKMPLSPPEWWWHTRCGLLALPMSSVRKYGLETIALGVILFFLGVFWNAIDSFLPWHVVKLVKIQSGDLGDKADDGEPLIIGLTLTIGALPAVVFLYFAEVIVDYCGHSNILIYCFVNYICHHLALIHIKDAYLLLICEVLETFTLHVMYITAVLYLRHLVPRKLTACGQALPVIAHFCLGRCFGALLGGIAYNKYPDGEYLDNFQNVHKWFTVAAAIVAIIYFVGYHFYMKPKCAAPMHLPPDPAPAVVQSMNGNGSYTPLRVYHNSKSKKGHFRY